MTKARTRSCRNMPGLATKDAMRAGHGIAIYREKIPSLFALFSWSEPRDRGQAHRARLTRGDFVVGVGSRPIALVEDVFHVQLHAPRLVDLGIDGGIDADEA